MPPFTITARDGAARAGLIHTAHGEVRTPAFVPLATTATVKSLHAAEVADLGYDMVLGNTFHLFIQPGPELIAEMGGLHEFMGWDRAIVTDSGGYQVFSMGHGSVAEEVKRRRERPRSMIVSIEEEGVRFRSYVDGAVRFMGPETSMEVQAKLGSDIALVFDECTPFHVEREYTERSMERTHRWLDRCLRWQADNGPDGQLVYGIVQGGVYEDLRAESSSYVAGSSADGIAIGGSLGQTKEQMQEVVRWSLDGLPAERPRHLLGIGDVDDLVHAVGAGVDTFDCATPTRLARHGTALVHDPERRWRLDLNRGMHRRSRAPIDETCSCPACREHTRGYLHYLVRANELTAKRLLTLHNLTFMERLMDEMRAAIEGGSFAELGAEVMAGGTLSEPGVALWLDEPYEPRPALAGDVEVEACVIGAGVAGLSCARRLAGHGIDTLVLERDTVASGASGRNGGFLLAGLAPFYPDLRSRRGRGWARRAYARTLAAQEEMYELARSLGADEYMRAVGLLRVSTSPDEADHVRRQVEALRADGFAGELIERDELPSVARRFCLNGCRTGHDGALHPARWIRALADGAERAGARICERSEVAAPVSAPGEGPLASGTARVLAHNVIVACDGALPLLVPDYAGRVRSRRLHMVATAPLRERVVDELVYARWGHEYFQQRPDGRLLLGGFSDVDGESRSLRRGPARALARNAYTASDRGSPRVWERIERHLREDLGIEAQITHRWSGVVGYSEDGLPLAGEVPGRPGLHVAGGYSGHGNVPGYLAGREIADSIAGAASEPPLFSA